VHLVEINVYMGKTWVDGRVVEFMLVLDEATYNMVVI